MNDKPQRRGILGAIGPAIITASVVLGPGSILTSSRLGFEVGMQLAWVVVLAALLMVGMTALAARLGVALDGTMCEELASRAGRPVAALVGTSIFFVAACFQYSNNLGVMYAIDPFIDPETNSQYLPIAAILVLNTIGIVALFGFKRLYIPLERLMMVLVGLMLIAFAYNLLIVKPDPVEIATGLVPGLPQDIDRGAVMITVTALIATTFSVAGAFYQSYLVRQKGWDRRDLKQGLVDSSVGIGVLGLISLMIMITAATVLHGSENVGKLETLADVAEQLRPSFGEAATVLFCLGIFAGAFSSLLVNAMVGGTTLSDGLGYGGSMDQMGPKYCTLAALLMGMIISVLVRQAGFSPVVMVIFAQGLTVLVLPVLAIAMLWLATRKDMVGDRRVPGWMIGLGVLGLIVTIALMAQKVMSLWDRLS